MPEISFECPGCQQNLEAPADTAGQTVACPSCGQHIEVPADANFKFNCPECDQRLEATPDLVGQEIQCPTCEKTITVPGPSALITALAISGLPTDSFVYLGFLPRRAGKRRATLQSVARECRTLVFFEAPHRLLKTLADLAEVWGDRRIALARELTKMFEEVWRGTVQEAIAHFQETPPHGEFTVVVEGAMGEEPWAEETVRQALADFLAEGLPRKEAARRVARMANWPRREVYRLSLESE